MTIPHKLSSSLTGKASVITLLMMIAGVLFAEPSAMAQQIPLTPQELEQQNRLQNVIAATTRNLEQGQKQVDGIVYTPRWSSPNPVVWVEPNSLSVLFVYCLPGEFADSGQEILGGSDLEVLESYSLAITSNLTGWLVVVQNEDENIRLPAAAGVICSSDANDAQSRILSTGEQQEINNIISQFITAQNTPVTNIDQVSNIINNVTTNAATIGPVTPPPPTNVTGTTTEQPLTVKIIPNATEGIYPITFDFEADATGGTEPYSYSWSTSYSAISGFDIRGSEKAFELANPIPGIYNVTVTATDSKNQTASDSVQITVEPPESPTVEIISNGTEGVAPATFRFEMNVNEGSKPLIWQWNFGDGEYVEQRQERTVEHTFEEAGTYNVVVRLLAAGGIASDNVVIVVEEQGGPQGGVTVGPTEDSSITEDEPDPSFF
jgi:plastocyanin